MSNGQELTPLGRAARWAYANELVGQLGITIGEALGVVHLRHLRGLYERRPQVGRGEAARLMVQGFAQPNVGASSPSYPRERGEAVGMMARHVSLPGMGMSSLREPHEPIHPRWEDAELREQEPPVEALVTLEPEAHGTELPPFRMEDSDPPALELVGLDFAAPPVFIPEVGEHGGVGRAISWRRFLEESGLFDPEPMGAEGGEGISAPVTSMDGGVILGPDSGQGPPAMPREAVMPLDMPLGGIVENTGPLSGFLAEGPSINNSETMITSPSPSGLEVEEEWNQRMMEERRERMELWGVPRVVLILCSLFWKLELLKICDLLHGPEAPPNDDEFCRRTAESIFQNNGRSGEILAPESRVTVHAIDVMKQTEDQIIHSIERYIRGYTHVIIIPNAFHFWELMEQQLGGVTTVYMKEITNRYVRIGSRLMRQGLAREVLILPFLPMGDPTCELIPRVNLTNVWNLLVDHCNQANDYIIIIATHMWTIEMAQGTMNVPNVVAWNFVPHDQRLAWEIYISHFTDRYERRRPITLRCGQVHRSGSHYLLYELWGLVQDTAATCECQMTVSVLRPLSRRQKRKFRAALQH